MYLQSNQLFRYLYIFQRSASTKVAVSKLTLELMPPKKIKDPAKVKKAPKAKPTPKQKVEKAPPLTCEIITGASEYIEQIRSIFEDQKLEKELKEDRKYDGYALIKTSEPVGNPPTKNPVLIALCVPNSGGDKPCPTMEELQVKARKLKSRAIFLSTPPALNPTTYFTHNVDSVSVANRKEGANYIILARKAALDKKKKFTIWSGKTEGCTSLPRSTYGDVYVTWVSMLMAIPHVSDLTAKAIAERYPSIQAMVQVCKDNDDQDMFAGIEIPVQGQQKTRRLGPKMSRTLYQIFSAVDPDLHAC